MSRYDLEIRPSADEFNAALIFVLDQLERGDEIYIHEEASPPWFRIVANDVGSILTEMQRLRVRVEPH